MSLVGTNKILRFHLTWHAANHVICLLHLYVNTPFISACICLFIGLSRSLLSYMLKCCVVGLFVCSFFNSFTCSVARPLNYYFVASLEHSFVCSFSHASVCCLCAFICSFGPWLFPLLRFFSSIHLCTLVLKMKTQRIQSNLDQKRTRMEPTVQSSA